MRRRPRHSRAVTLVEVLITVALMGLVTGAAILGVGVAAGARLKRSGTMIAGAIRIAYAHANAKSRPVRLVFDFEERMVILEESTGQLLVKKTDRTGGAAGATEAERAAIEEAESILKGPRAPRPAFEPTKAFGWNADADRPGKTLERGIRFLQVETGHQDEPESTGRAYLYFWPGGQTERAAIQLMIADAGEENEDSVMSLLVSPLTGKAELKRGKVSMPRPRDADEESEREDTGS
ncbi:MAG: prepilin-type N-terminal cleavage/methylation domain-containing protein [Polyangiaceae bacterium]|nr:prepilin-type N-terminal cleavage/methylation domain-containing protein [Polyangiaceae bacterium]